MGASPSRCTIYLREFSEVFGSLSGMSYYSRPRGRGPNRGGGRGRRGRGPPPGLSGKEIGMYYREKGLEKKKLREKYEVIYGIKRKERHLEYSKRVCPQS